MIELLFMARFMEKKIKILSQSDILIHLSENEEFPLIQIECLGLGLPFLSYKNVGGISKIKKKQVINYFMIKIIY